VATDNETRVELARLDERNKALLRELERSERSHELALKIASDELARRLDVLNHAHQQAEEARRETVPRETFDNVIQNMRQDIEALKGDAREQRGKMWLPMIAIATLAAAIAAAAVKFVVR
jgi:hypothetical protein